MSRKWRRKRAVNKVKPGDGSALRPFRRWQSLTRSLFFLNRTDDDGVEHTLAVDVRYFAENWRAELYRDGVQVATSGFPAVFPVPGGVIEAHGTTFGLARMHFVPDRGDEHVLHPHPWSGEGLRANFGKRFPRASSLIGVLAIVVLLISLVVLIPQLIEWVTQFEVMAENVGTFTSPISLPAWANSALGVAGILAAIERGLTLRNHWLIDVETWWLGD